MLWLSNIFPVKKAAVNAGIGAIIGFVTFAFGAAASTIYRSSGASYSATAAGVKFSKASLPMIYNMKALRAALTISGSVSLSSSAATEALGNVRSTDQTSNNLGILNNTNINNNNFISNNNGALSLKATRSADDRFFPLTQSMLHPVHKVSTDPKSNIIEGVISMGGPIGSPIAFKYLEKKVLPSI
ncbi:hypothetical protein [Photobacterium phosphoreum]|uniref:hypothetical protein n=1 Tax=Photobacterium phosphoreum TaxID=659 RepID=UPI0007F8FB3F|nr:hypothetical protein [Photobacterium phosphoreum]OBU34325.1 hypothetical protein AYY24_17585 [Photobacterium phosphoreum]PSW37393.1 hypothetical protein CTM87_07465 [Photobacterium phosphoreum]